MLMDHLKAKEKYSMRKYFLNCKIMYYIYLLYVLAWLIYVKIWFLETPAPSEFSFLPEPLLPGSLLLFPLNILKPLTTPSSSCICHYEL